MEKNNKSSAIFHPRKIEKHNHVLSFKKVLGSKTANSSTLKLQDQNIKKNYANSPTFNSSVEIINPNGILKTLKVKKLFTHLNNEDENQQHIKIYTDTSIENENKNKLYENEVSTPFFQRYLSKINKEERYYTTRGSSYDDQKVKNMLNENKINIESNNIYKKINTKRNDKLNENNNFKSINTKKSTDSKKNTQTETNEEYKNNKTNLTKNKPIKKELRITNNPNNTNNNNVCGLCNKKTKKMLYCPRCYHAFCENCIKHKKTKNKFCSSCNYFINDISKYLKKINENKIITKFNTSKIINKQNSCKKRDKNLPRSIKKRNAENYEKDNNQNISRYRNLNLTDIINNSKCNKSKTKSFICHTKDIREKKLSSYTYNNLSSFISPNNNIINNFYKEDEIIMNYDIKNIINKFNSENENLEKYINYLNQIIKNYEMEKKINLNYINNFINTYINGIENKIKEVKTLINKIQIKQSIITNNNKLINNYLNDTNNNEESYTELINSIKDNNLIGNFQLDYEDIKKKFNSKFFITKLNLFSSQIINNNIQNKKFETKLFFDKNNCFNFIILNKGKEISFEVNDISEKVNILGNILISYKNITKEFELSEKKLMDGKVSLYCLVSLNELYNNELNEDDLYFKILLCNTKY